MNAKTERDLRNSRPERLSEVKAQYTALLERDPDNADAKEALALVNQLLQEHGTAPEKRVKVEAIVTTPIDGKVLEKGSQMEVTETQYNALAARLKRLSVFIGILALMACVIIPVRSQNALSFSGQLQSQFLTQTNGIVFDGTNVSCICTGIAASNYYQIIGLGKFGDVGIFFGFRLMTAGSGALTAIFDGSPDGGTNWVPAVASLAVTANGTTAVGGWTNITLNSMPYLRLAYITNANTGTAIATNLLIKVVTKPSRFGT